MSGPLPFDHAVSTRAGGREVNEDYVDVLHAAEASCWVVADGLGGHRGGAVASKLVVESALRSFQEHSGVTAADVERHVQQAQEALLAAQRSDSSLATMRSTIVVLVANEREAVWGHVGDSRLYHVRGGRVVSRTRDHSVSQALVDGGQIDRRQQGSHEDRSRLLRSLGKDAEPANPTIGGPERLCRDDAFLICTDGFWEALDETAIEIDYAAAEDAEAWLERLIARLLAQELPLNDNYTAAAVRVIRGAAGSSPSPSASSRSSAAASAGVPPGPTPPGLSGVGPGLASASGIGSPSGVAFDADAGAGLFGTRRATAMRVLYALMALSLLALLYTAYVAYGAYAARHDGGGGELKSTPVDKGAPPKPLVSDAAAPSSAPPADPNAAAVDGAGRLGNGSTPAPSEKSSSEKLSTDKADGNEHPKDKGKAKP